MRQVHTQEATLRTSDVTRRRLLELAILTTASIALPIPRVWAVQQGRPCDGDQGSELGVDLETWRPTNDPPTLEEIPFPPDGAWFLVDGHGHSGSSHYSTSPRKSYIMVHHCGCPNSHLNSACTSCSCLSSSCSNPHEYDFCIARDGSICDTGRWSKTTGAHAKGCNSCSVGIMLQGCFGGCSSGNVSGPSDAQICSLARLSLHLGTDAFESRHRPHARCAHWNCDGSSSPTHKDCPGTNLTVHDHTDHWNSAGHAMLNKMLSYRANLAKGCNCKGDICIT